MLHLFYETKIHDKKKAVCLVNEQSEVAILLAGPVLLGVLALAPWVLILLYSSDFTAAATILRWHILGDVLKIVSWPIGMIIVAAGHGRALILTEVGAVSVFVLVTWFGLPSMGVEVTGIAFFAMYAIHLVLVFWMGLKIIGFRWTLVVKKYLIILFVLACFTAGAAMSNDILGAVVGSCSAIVFGVISINALAKMAGMDRLMEKLFQVFNRIRKALRFKYDNKK